MTIPRVNGAGWGVGDELTSAEINAIDASATYALDKRAGETDTLESVVTCAGAGRIVSSTVIGANANTTYQVSGGNTIIRLTSAIAASYTYTLSASGAQAGDVIFVVAESSFPSGRTVAISNGSVLFRVGNGADAHGTWASFLFTGSTWIVFQRSHDARQVTEEFTADDTWTCPEGVTEVILTGIGGGGGGGGAGGGDLATASGAGSGGGGALANTVRIAVAPGSVYSIVIGGGGAAGPGGVSGANRGVAGSDGSDTEFKLGSTELAIFLGAAGGNGGAYTALAGAEAYARGGNAARGVARPAMSASVSEIPQPGQGGWGSRGTSGTLLPIYRAGGGSAAAMGGAYGPDADGDGGGGGGASGWVGGVAGAGGASSSGGNGADGAAGTYGAGGGGGGGGVVDGGSGGAGGDGALRIIYVK